MGMIERSLGAVERVGNRLPDPVTLFLILIAIVIVLSVITAWAGVAVIHPISGDQIAAINLLSADQVRRILTEMSQTFADFPPLGMVLVVMLGVGVAEKSGLVAAALTAFVRRVPRPALSGALVFAGVMSSLAADAGYVVLIPLGAVVFYAAGRHPIAGLAAAFAGVSGGFSANLVLTSLDPLLAGISQSAAQIVDPAYQVPITANYYMMITLVPIFVAVGALITDRLIEPRLGSYDETPEGVAEAAEDGAGQRGLRAAGWTGLLFLIAVALLVVPEGAPLRGEDGGLDPLYRSLVAIMALGFFLVGMAYGIAEKAIKSDRDAVQMTASSMSDMGLYIVLAFVAAHFIALFNWSNLGVITAILGAEGLKAIGFTGIPLAVSFVFVAAFINLFVGSASAKWAIMSTIFVPLMMLLGYSPELTQAAYRIGDSVTNILTPLMPYFPLVIVFGRRYVKDFGIGTLIATMLPYSVSFGLAGIALLITWMLLGLPLGPGVEILMPAT